MQVDGRGASRVEAPAGAGWTDVAVDLSAGEGEVTLVLEASADRCPGLLLGEPRLVWGSAAAPGSVAALSPPATPDAWVVLVDTLRADVVGFLGGPADTPRMDAFAAGGVVFEQARAPSGHTVDSVGALFSGLPPALANPRGIAGPVPPADVPTLAERLGKAGYRTVALSANSHVGPLTGLTRGFDVVLGADDEALVQALERHLSATDPRRPLFLWLQLIGPHLPYELHEASASSLRRHGLPLDIQGVPELDQLRAAGPEDPVRELARALYEGDVAQVDSRVGRALDLAAASGRPPPWIALTSDHGEEFWDHDGFEHGHTLYEELLRIPLVLGGPGVAPHRRTEPVSLDDLGPTLLELAGSAPLTGGGRSLLPLVAGGDWPGAEQRVLPVGGTLYGDPQVGLVQGRQKLLLLGGERPRLRIFDLEETDLLREWRGVGSPQMAELQARVLTLRGLARGDDGRLRCRVQAGADVELLLTGAEARLVTEPETPTETQAQPDPSRVGAAGERATASRSPEPGGGLRVRIDAGAPRTVDLAVSGLGAAVPWLGLRAWRGGVEVPSLPGVGPQGFPSPWSGGPVDAPGVERAPVECAWQAPAGEPIQGDAQRWRSEALRALGYVDGR